MRAVVRELVVLDDDEAGDGGKDGDIVEGGVGVGAFPLLLGGVSGLEDEDAFDEEQYGGGVEELAFGVSTMERSLNRDGQDLQGGQRRASDHG